MVVGDMTKYFEGKNLDAIIARLSDPDIATFVTAFWRTAWGTEFQEEYGIREDPASLLTTGEPAIIGRFCHPKLGLSYELDLESADPRYLVKTRDGVVEQTSLSRLVRRSGDQADLLRVCNAALESHLDLIRGVKTLDPASGFDQVSTVRSAKILNLRANDLSPDSLKGLDGQSLSYLIVNKLVSDYITKNFHDLKEMGHFSHYFVIPMRKVKGSDKKHPMIYLFDFGDDNLIQKCFWEMKEYAKQKAADAGARQTWRVILDDLIKEPDGSARSIISDIYDRNDSSLLIYRMYALTRPNIRIYTDIDDIIALFPEKGRIVVEIEESAVYHMNKKLEQRVVRNGQSYSYGLNSITAGDLEVCYVGEDSMDWFDVSRREWLQTSQGRQWLSSEEGSRYLKTGYGKQWLSNKKESGFWLDTHMGHEWLSTSEGCAFLSSDKGRDWLISVAGIRYLRTPQGMTWRGSIPEESKEMYLIMLEWAADELVSRRR